MCHIPAVKTISIRELHANTGQWLRKVVEEHEVIVTDRGRPIARMLPPEKEPAVNPLLRRKLLPGVARLIERPIGGPDSAAIISEMREDR